MTNGDNMYEVTVEMRDEFTGKTVTRVIDGSNLMVHDGETSYMTHNPETQSQLLKTWIEERANEQHETILSLVSWYTRAVS
jgi:hypothetical protein